jgi:DNA-binding NtrC family response regulator
MKIVSSVLLVHNEPEAFRPIQEMLKDQEIWTHHARNDSEARRLLRELESVDLVLTDVAVADGTWRDVIRLAEKRGRKLPVIVISRVVNMRLYLDTQDCGAADFIVPPIGSRDLAYTLTTAMHRMSPDRCTPAPIRHEQNQPAVH